MTYDICKGFKFCFCDCTFMSALHLERYIFLSSSVSPLVLYDIRPSYPTPESLHHLVPMLSDSGVDLLQSMLVYDPQKRINCRTALMHAYLSEPPEVSTGARASASATSVAVAGSSLESSSAASSAATASAVNTTNSSHIECVPVTAGKTRDDVIANSPS